ncbi:MAG: M28 family peptidase [Acidobacteriota bacterium]|nr:M28 family peptidase [Acidobacteriota bacterium]
MVVAAVATLAILAAGVFVLRARRPFLSRFTADVQRLVLPGRIGETLDVLAKSPHRAGTPANAAAADEVARRLTAAGLKPWSDVHDVELWEPVTLSLALTKPAARNLDLHERALAEDPATAVAEKELPFLAYAPDGDVEAPLVYAGFGGPADFAALRKAGVDVRGKIAIVKAQGVCRGMKALAAERAGVAGLLIYIEPRDQGIMKAPYPEGPATNRWAASRGTLLKYFLRPGDPRRAKAAGVDTLPKIPALAISQEVAEALLKEIGGPAPPADWKGLLAAPYSLGPGPARARMIVHGKTVRASLRNVLATIPGADPKAAPVVLASHIDAWVYGAVDPSSGTAAVLEVATVLAALADRGWTPSRPVVFAFFDGEEFGMLGSTRWLETRLTGADLPALAFLNVDSAVRANDLYVSTTPGLRGPLAEVLALVNDPDSGKTLQESSGEPALPGFSSDAAPFLGFSATPVAELGFGRWYGSYHTLYDTTTWLKRFGDPGFRRTAALARVLALYVGVLATPRFFPLRFSEISDFSKREIREIQARHPASISWVPLAVRSLTSQTESFETVARAWDARTRASRGPGDDAGRFDRLVSLALGAFGVPGESFGRGCRLWGPSPETGCGAVGLPGLEAAVTRGERTPAARESDLLAVAFSLAREQLVLANFLADGGRPRSRPGPAGTRRP